MTRRMWPGHAIGLALCLAALVFSYAAYAVRLPFESALHKSLSVPVYWGEAMFPVTIVVGWLCLVLFFGGYERRNRGILVGGYALLASYWAAIATMFADLDF